MSQKDKGGKKAELPREQQVIVDLEDTWALKRCVSCQNSTGSDLVWNRDRNASLNIVGIYLASTYAWRLLADAPLSSR
uniref:Uncharacterized protein n=1 Tax=viral metagenome TaxID=1070528 RepID=A0A6C0BZ68_9ZZZZ